MLFDTSVENACLIMATYRCLRRPQKLTGICVNFHGLIFQLYAWLYHTEQSISIRIKKWKKNWHAAGLTNSKLCINGEVNFSITLFFEKFAILERLYFWGVISIRSLTNWSHGYSAVQHIYREETQFWLLKTNSKQAT